MMADPFAWMRHRDLPAMHSYLAAERRYYDQQMAPLAGLRDELAAELTARQSTLRWDATPAASVVLELTGLSLLAELALESAGGQG